MLELPFEPRALDVAAPCRFPKTADMSAFHPLRTFHMPNQQSREFKGMPLAPDEESLASRIKRTSCHRKERSGTLGAMAPAIKPREQR
jgi:hypothetical protein